MFVKNKKKTTSNKIPLRIILFVLLIGFTFQISVFSQTEGDIRFERISLEQGLSQVAVNCTLQDSLGFIWLGTQDGLNKYDGYKFTIYRHDPESSASLSNNYVLSIFEDAEGNLWIGTYGGGLNKFDRRSETFNHYQNQADNPQSLSHNAVRSIFEDSAGNLWIGTQDGLNKLVPSNNEGSPPIFTRYRNQADNPRSLSHNAVRSIFEDSEGSLWIGTEGGLNKLVPSDKEGSPPTFTRYRDQAGNPQNLTHNIILSISEDSGNNLWIGTQDGLNKLVPSDKEGSPPTFTHYQNQADNPRSLSHNTVRSIFKDSRGNLWIGTEDGLNKLVPSDNVGSPPTFTRYRNQSDNPQSLSHNFVRSIIEDFEGSLWVGTDSGLNKFDRKAEAFTRYRNQADNPRSLSDNDVFSIIEDTGGNLWIGTYNGGLNKLIPSDNEGSPPTFIHYQHQADNPQSLSHNTVRSVFEDSRGNLWIGTAGGGLNKLVPSDKEGSPPTFIHFQHEADDPRSLSHNSVLSIFEDSRGDLWIGTDDGGLNKLIPSDNKGSPPTFTRFQYQADNPQSLSSNSVYSIFEDTKGNLWIGTLGGGLNKLVPSNKEGSPPTFTCFQHQTDNPQSLSHNTIRSIFEDSQGNLWIGTAGGLNKLVPSNNEGSPPTFTYYREKDGLPNDFVYGILEDENGNLWMSTNNGISKFNPKTEKFINYDKKDGLQSNEFNSGAYYKDRAGRMYFGGVNGLNAFYPKSIQDNTYIPPVVIADFLLFNKSVEVVKTGIESEKFQLEHHINYTKEITLDYTDYIFAFEFSALNYRQSEKNQYKYMLEGLDKDWIETDYKHRRATYTNLSHGKYVFRVKASNDDGYWNEEGASIKLTIFPPPWKTWWAYTLYILALLGLIFWFIQSQRKKVLQKQKELDRVEKLVTERTADVVRQKDEISKQKEEIQTQAEELRKLSIVARETDNAVIIMDSMGNLEWINEGFTRMYGMTLEQILTEKGRNLIDASSNANIEQSFKKCIEEKNAISYETHNKLDNNETIWTQTTLTPILDQNGNIKKLIAIDSDITAIKKAEEVAEKANHAKSEFLARMSHEIRTPMNGVIGFTEMLLETELSEEQLDYTRTINRSGEALINLLTDILDFSKIEAGELSFDPIDFDPELTAFDICDLVAPRIGVKDVEILCRIGDEVPAFIRADPGRLRQVIVNLMSNAAKFTHQGEIELFLDVEEEEEKRLKLHISVRDTGIGIAKSKLKNVFEAFQQADGSTTRKYGGTGLGLAICKQISHLMGGDVWVESEENQGSTFYFTCWVEKSNKKISKEKIHDYLEGKRVLIVDDNPTNLEILSHVLELSGMEVVSLTDPKQMIPLLKDHVKQDIFFDIGIIDVQMPGISGFDLCKSIRKEKPPISDLPLLAFSSSTLSRSMRFREAGFNGYLPKPIQRKKLVRMVGRLLGKKEAIHEEEGFEEIVTQHTITEESKHTVNILLAEDNPVNLKLAKFILEKAGYNLTVSLDGKEVVEKFTSDPESFDLILMDIQMPKMDGRQATQKIRESGFTDIPIIAMTAEAMKGDREKCLEAGMNDYIPKPIKRDVVYQMVKKWCL